MGVVSVWERRSELKRDWDVATEGAAAGDARSSKEVGEVEKGDVRKVGGDGRSFEGGGELAGIHLDEADEAVGAGGEGIETDDIAGEGLHYGCFESSND